MAMARIVESGARPAPKRIAGFDIRILLSGDDAQAFEVFLTSGKDGTGPAPHSHPWDETFYVLRGPVVFGVGERKQAVEAGTLLHVPGGERHWYRFGVEEGEFLSFTSGKDAAAMYAIWQVCPLMHRRRIIRPWRSGMARRHDLPRVEDEV